MAFHSLIVRDMVSAFGAGVDARRMNSRQRRHEVDLRRLGKGGVGVRFGI